MKSIKYFVTAMLVIVFLLLVSGCTDDISEIQDDSYVGKEVTVKGTVLDTVKLGELSGYTLQDDSGNKIAVSSGSLPKEGTEKKITGTLEKNKILNFYFIEVSE